MITRSNLADQLREYQIRSKHDWASLSFSSTTNLTSSRKYAFKINGLFLGPAFLVILTFCPKLPSLKATILAKKIVFCSTSSKKVVDVVVFVIWELVILAFLVFSAVSLYFRHMQLAFILVCITSLLLLCMKVTKQVRLARKKKRRMLLPLSM